MDEQNEEVNVLLENIREVLPVFLHYIPEKSEKWKKLNEVYSEVVKKRLEGMGPDDTILVSATIYDMIVHLKMGNRKAFYILRFISGLLQDLQKELLAEEVKMIGKRSVYSMLRRMDYWFYHFVGEIAVLRGLMGSGKYRLVSVEARVPDCSKRIEFKLKRMDSGGLHLVEVYNVFPDEEKVEEDDESIRTYIENKNRKKREEKVTKEPFDLILVFWGTAATLGIYSDFLKRNEMWIPRLACYAYSAFSDQQSGRYQTRFRNLKTLFDSE